MLEAAPCTGGGGKPDASHSLFIARRIMSPQADWHSQLPRSYGFLWCWRGHPPLHLKRLCKSRPFASTRPKKKGLGGSKGVQWAKLCLYGKLQPAQLSLIKIGSRIRIMTFLPKSEAVKWDWKWINENRTYHCESQKKVCLMRKMPRYVLDEIDWENIWGTQWAL